MLPRPNIANLYADPYSDLLGEMANIHPDTIFGENNRPRIGRGVIIEEGCKIGNNTIIGNYVVMRPNTIIGDNCMIGHLTVFEGDTTIGDRVTVQTQCHITSKIIIEDDVFIAPMTCCINTHRIKHGRDFELILKGATIRRAARIGARTLVMPGIEIGENAQVGAGSLVTKNIPARECWFGSPAVFKKLVPPEELL